MASLVYVWVCSCSRELGDHALKSLHAQLELSEGHTERDAHEVVELLAPLLLKRHINT